LGLLLRLEFLDFLHKDVVLLLADFELLKHIKALGRAILDLLIELFDDLVLLLKTFAKLQVLLIETASQVWKQ